MGLRAGFVDVLAFMPEMWLSAFVPMFFLQVLETSPCRGGAAEIFNFSLNCLHFYLVTHVQSLLFCAASIGGGVEPSRRVAGIASWGVATLTFAVSRFRSRFYVGMPLCIELVNFELVVCNILWISDIIGRL